MANLNVNKIHFLSYLEYYSSLIELKEKGEGLTDIALNNWVLCDEWTRQYISKRRKEMRKETTTYEYGKRKEKVEVEF